jgi:orotidine-5'-phosphate decarboxylase
MAEAYVGTPQARPRKCNAVAGRLCNVRVYWRCSFPQERPLTDRPGEREATHAEREAGKRIVFPLDFDNPSEARDFAERLEGRVGVFKVGLELFVSAGPDVLQGLGAAGDIFLDLKFHDIPATVRGAARAAAALGVRFISVHASGGLKMLEAAVEGAGGRTEVLAITALTSLDNRDLARLGLRDDLTDPGSLVLHRAAMAREAGCSGIVCSGREAAAVRAEMGRHFVILVPGVRPEWAEVPLDDQARVTTPAEAVAAGGDFIVVGRPIRLADDPAEAALKTAKEIAKAL